MRVLEYQYQRFGSFSSHHSGTQPGLSHGIHLTLAFDWFEKFHRLYRWNRINTFHFISELWALMNGGFAKDEKFNSLSLKAHYVSLTDMTQSLHMLPYLVCRLSLATRFMKGKGYWRCIVYYFLKWLSVPYFSDYGAHLILSRTNIIYHNHSINTNRGRAADTL